MKMQKRVEAWKMFMKFLIVPTVWKKLIPYEFFLTKLAV